MARRKSEPKQPYRVARTRSERRKHSSECHQRQQTDGDENQERGNVFAGPCNAFLLQENGGRPRHRGWECISGGRPGERAFVTGKLTIEGRNRDRHILFLSNLPVYQHERGAPHPPTSTL